MNLSKILLYVAIAIAGTVTVATCVRLAWLANVTGVTPDHVVRGAQLSRSGAPRVAIGVFGAAAFTRTLL